jgi:hypothetical protein
VSYVDQLPKASCPTKGPNTPYAYDVGWQEHVCLCGERWPYGSRHPQPAAETRYDLATDRLVPDWPPAWVGWS